MKVHSAPEFCIHSILIMLDGEWVCPGTVSATRQDISDMEEIPDISTEGVAEMEDDPVRNQSLKIDNATFF